MHSLGELQAYKTALDAHAIVAVTDREGRIVDVNDKFCAISRYRRDELIGQTHRIVNSGVHPPEFFRDMWRTITRGEIWQGEICNRAKDGSLYWVNSTIAPIFDGGGNIDRYIAIRTEITAHKRLEVNLTTHHDRLAEMVEERTRELARETTLLNALLDSLPDLVFFKDTQGRYLGCNPPFAALVGRTREEIAGKTDFDLFPAELALRFRERNQAILVNPEVREISEGKVCFADGRKIWLHTLLAPLYEGEQQIGLLGVGRDITRIKEVERELKRRYEETRLARDAAERANAAKSEFLTNMTHELRTPMHAILSFARLGLDRLERVAPEKLRGYFEHIHGSGQRLLNLINDLLDLSKLEAGRIELSPAPCNVAALVRDIAAELAPLFDNKRLVLEVDVPAGVDPIVPADAARLGQVIRNLLSNAIKFTPEGRRIMVNLATDSLPHGRRRSDHGQRAALRLTVADEGVGIPKGELEVVFDKFVQSSKTHTGAGGTGLGLAICREILELHGGRIGARNGMEGGAAFDVLLPRYPDVFAPETPAH